MTLGLSVSRSRRCSCVNLLPPPDDLSFLRTAHRIYAKHHKFPQALTLSIRLGDPELIRKDFNAPANLTMKKQLAFILARAQVPKEWLDPEDGMTDGESELPEEILECLSNTRLSAQFKEFGKELSVLEPKSLEDVYKSHLENTSEFLGTLLTLRLVSHIALQGQQLPPTSTRQRQIWLEPSSMRSSMRDSATTSSWRRRKRETAGCIRTRTTVCSAPPRVLV